MKKGLVYFSISITLAILAGVFFILNNNRQYKGNNAIKGIPVDAAVIIRISDIASLSDLILKDIDYSAELEKFSLSSKVFSLIRQLDSLDIFTESAFEKLKQKQVIASFVSLFCLANFIIGTVAYVLLPNHVSSPIPESSVMLKIGIITAIVTLINFWRGLQTE